MNSEITIIAGPCSVNGENHDQLFDIARITVPSYTNEITRPVWGVRVVGLKSRTVMQKDGEGMGLDFPIYLENVERLLSGEPLSTLKILPSAEVGKRLAHETGVVVASEIVDPLIQLASYEKVLSREQLFLWNPAVNQLGHPAFIMGEYARKNDWYIGIKNGKWLGDTNESGMGSMEKCWSGLTSYIARGESLNTTHRLALIHRGVDVSDKGNYRNLPVHDAAERVKESTGTPLYFDPSHTFGPILRDTIVENTIDAMKKRMKDGNYLYDGLLIEVGDSTTDTKQHITVKELTELCTELGTFRDFRTR